MVRWWAKPRYMVQLFDPSTSDGWDDIDLLAQVGKVAFGGHWWDAFQYLPPGEVMLSLGESDVGMFGQNERKWYLTNGY